LLFAIPDHPWVDSNDGAAVRIAMTVGGKGDRPGRLQQITAEGRDGDDVRGVTLNSDSGKIYADLTIGADVAGAATLQAMQGISSPGVKLHGAGFIVDAEQAMRLGFGELHGIDQIIRQYRNGRDLTQKPRDVQVIDLFGVSESELRDQHPAIYQWVHERVKPERDQNKRATYRNKWWIFGEPRREWRLMQKGLPRYIATVETTKHRIFQFLDAAILPDNMLVNVASDQADFLGVLSSRIHVVWSLAVGSRLGMGNDPRYNKTRCFETFPFPELTLDQSAAIGDLAERIDALRKTQQAAHAGLTLTGTYNVLEKLRRGEVLANKEQVIHEQGLVSVLLELHDDLDRAVFAAYGWDDLADKLVGLPGATTPLIDKPEDQQAAEQELLVRLVALNQQRAAEEARGHIRWLRPAYQAPSAEQAEISLESETKGTTIAVAATTKKPAWPKQMREQIEVLLNAMQSGPQSAAELAEGFKRKPLKPVEQVLSALEVLGRAHQQDDYWRLK